MDLDAVTMCLPVKTLQSKQLAPFFSKLFPFDLSLTGLITIGLSVNHH